MAKRQKTIKMVSEEEVKLARQYHEAQKAFQEEARELHQRHQQEMAALNLRSTQTLFPLYAKMAGGRIENPEEAWRTGEWYFNTFFGDFGDYFFVHMVREDASEDSEPDEDDNKLVIQ